MTGKRPKSLVLYGGSRLGKTSWARSLGNHLYFEKMISAKVAINGMAECEYAVMDDCSIMHTPGYKGWFGAQAEIGLRKLHHDAVYVKWGKPIIWCCNRDPRIDMRQDMESDRGHTFWQDDIDWMEENCHFVAVTSPIFRASTG